MLAKWAMSRGLRRNEDQPPPVTPAYDREAERVTSGEILAQAQWLYEQHERRVQNCQNLAVAILTVVGAIIALSPTVLPDHPECWHYILMGMTALAAIGTAIQCVRVLVPRSRIKGLPALHALRNLARQHTDDEPIPVPVTQFMVDLLNTKNPHDDSPLSEAAADAERRTNALVQVFWWFAATFVLVIVMSTLFALVK
jgi:chorismate mutase